MTPPTGRADVGSPPAPPPRLPTDPAELLTQAAQGHHGALARLITVVETGGEAARAVTRLVGGSEVPYTIGLTGAPGAGKSTLTTHLLSVARSGWPPGPGHGGEAVDRVAVLAVDPTSSFSRGAILGDRVRMQDHATDPSVFIRSMATRGHLGGLALAVPDAVRVLGAAGIPLVIVETVGVGQVEIEVASSVDTTVVVVTPGWGDSMQASKAGLLEVADIFVVNKADRPGARECRRDLDQMLDLSSLGDWRPLIVDTSAVKGEGIGDLWAALAEHRSYLMGSGELERRRAARADREVQRILREVVAQRVESLMASDAFAETRAAVRDGGVDPYQAVERLLELWPGS